MQRGPSTGQIGVCIGGCLAGLQIGSLSRRGCGLLLRNHLVHLHRQWTRSGGAPGHHGVCSCIATGMCGGVVAMWAARLSQQCWDNQSSKRTIRELAASTYLFAAPFSACMGV